MVGARRPRGRGVQGGEMSIGARCLVPNQDGVGCGNLNKKKNNFTLNSPSDCIMPNVSFSYKFSSVAIIYINKRINQIIF